MIHVDWQALHGPCYVDTSAYVEFILGGERGAQVERDIGARPRVSSVLLLLETQRTLIRLAREERLNPVSYQSCRERLEIDTRNLALRELSFDLCGNFVMPLTSTPRSLDLAHLRTALWFHARKPLAKFVTLDDQQRSAAKELGLPV